MSWIQKLHDTYVNCQSMVGRVENELEVPLLPICHTTQKAHIEIAIDGNGNFRRARVIPKDEARTIIPCTEDSGGRTTNDAPHPLCDKLQYVAMDYLHYGGRKKHYFATYLAQLQEWNKSAFGDPKIAAVLAYVRKGQVIEDLINHQILIPGPDGKLLDRWDKKKDNNAPKIFEVTSSQEEAFIRWIVEIPGDPAGEVWKDETLWNKWIQFYFASKKETSLCYVTGEQALTANQHPAKIRNDGDKAKLISSNDKTGFTFRGRFLDASQAASVGFDITQKAHYALRWLISRQGYKQGDLAIVAWATSGAPVPQPTDDTYSVLEIDELPTDEAPISITAQEVAIKLRKRIAGYSSELGDTSDVVVLSVDSATTGRLAIIFYRELTGSDFLNRINDWHTTCAWLHHYRMKEVQDKAGGKKKKKVIPFIGAPAPGDIAEAAYGRRLDDKLRKTTVSRILPCIIDGQPLPRDLVEAAVRRACNRVAIGNWEWNKTLSIACALFKHYNRKENYSMVLDPDRKTRDYLYGRLLALAESLESWALNEAGENRETNAARMMQRFAERPFSTWRTIELALTPYKARLGGKSIKRQRMIDEVIASFKPDDFINDNRLSGEFLLGYHCQRESLRGNRDLVEDTDNELEQA